MRAWAYAPTHPALQACDGLGLGGSPNPVLAPFASACTLETPDAATCTYLTYGCFAGDAPCAAAGSSCFAPEEVELVAGARDAFSGCDASAMAGDFDGNGRPSEPAV